MFNRQVVARTLPFGLYILFLVIASTIDEPWRIWVYPVQITCVALTLVWYRRDYNELRGAEVGRTHVSALDVAWAVGLGVAVFVAWINLDVAYLSLPHAPGIKSDIASTSLYVSWITVRILGSALIVPLMEELFWRSFLMRWIDTRSFLLLDPRMVTARALCFSALAFGFEHSLWFAGVIAGLAYGWLYRRGNLWLPIASHAVTNLLLGLWVIYADQWQFW